MPFDEMRELQAAADSAGLEMEFLELRKAAEMYRWLRDGEGAHALYSAAYFNTQTPSAFDAQIYAAMISARAVG